MAKLVHAKVFSLSPEIEQLPTSIRYQLFGMILSSLAPLYNPSKVFDLNKVSFRRHVDL